MEKQCDCCTLECVGGVGHGKRLIINGSMWLCLKNRGYTMKEKEGFLIVIIESAGNEHYP
jgi:hypothetical protein